MIFHQTTSASLQEICLVIETGYFLQSFPLMLKDLYKTVSPIVEWQ